MAGGGIFLLAGLGLVLCLGATAGAWVAKARMDAVGDAVFGTAGEGFEFVEEKLGRVKQGLERSRQPASDLSRIAGRLKNAESGVRQEWEPLLQTMDVVCQHLQSAASWLDSAGAFANGVSRVSETLVSSDFAAARQESAGVAVARDLQAFSRSVADALSQIQSMRTELIDLRNAGVLAREAALALIDRMMVLDQVLDRMGGRLDNVEAKVASARAACAEQGRRFRRWTLVATLAASLLPLWFGLSQVLVMVYGWRMARPALQ